MKGFQKVVVVGVLLVTLLIVIDITDAGKSKQKKKEIEANNEKETSKKSNAYKRSGEESNEYVKEETKTYKGKKGIKKDKTFEEDNSPKITKTYQKVKKYKIVEDGPAEKFVKAKSKKSTNSQNNKENLAEEVYKPVKKSSKKVMQQKKKKDNIEEVVNEELNNLYGLESTYEEDENAANSKRKKYKLVEVVLEEDSEENQEVNETILEVGSDEEELSGIQRTESEEVIEKFKTTETVKLSKNKKSPVENKIQIEDDNTEESEDYIPYGSELDLSEDSHSNIERYSAINEDEDYSSCRKIPHDPNRKGPKKLTLYVIEEEIDGQIQKRVVEEEDGVSMCEMADLLQEQYSPDLS